MKKHLPAILFWGAVWGICEATIGFVMHLAAVALPGLPGALMFPIGFFCMYRALKATEMRSAAFSIALIAAAVKLTDFLLPGHDAIRVINPALSILMEGLAVTAVCALFPANGRVTRYLQTLGMGVLWRVMFAGYMFLISLFHLPAGLVTSGAGTLLRFLLLESFLNSLVMSAGLWLGSKIPSGKPRKIGPAAAFTACLAAIVIQVLL